MKKRFIGLSLMAMVMFFTLIACGVEVDEGNEGNTTTTTTVNGNGFVSEQTNMCVIGEWAVDENGDILWNIMSLTADYTWTYTVNIPAGSYELFFDDDISYDAGNDLFYGDIVSTGEPGWSNNERPLGFYISEDTDVTFIFNDLSNTYTVTAASGSLYNFGIDTSAYYYSGILELSAYTYPGSGVYTYSWSEDPGNPEAFGVYPAESITHEKPLTGGVYRFTVTVTDTSLNSITEDIVYTNYASVYTEMSYTIRHEGTNFGMGEGYNMNMVSDNIWVATRGWYNNWTESWVLMPAGHYELRFDNDETTDNVYYGIGGWGTYPDYITFYLSEDAIINFEFNDLNDTYDITTSNANITIDPVYMYDEMFIAGSFNGWNFQPFELISDNTWMFTNHLSAGSYDFKLDCDTNWLTNFGAVGETAEWGVGTANLSFTLTEDADFTMIFDDLTDTFTISASTGTAASFRVVPSSTLSADTYTLIPGAGPTGSFTYSWSVDGGNPEAVTLSATDVENPTFTKPATVGDYTFNVTATDGNGDSISGSVTITVTSFSSVRTELYVVGSMNGWNHEAMTLVADNTWEKTITDVAAGEYEFKFDDTGTWVNPSYGYYNGNSEWNNDAINLSLTTSDTADLTFSFDDSTDTFTVVSSVGTVTPNNY